MNEIEELRQRNRPDEVRLLFVGESPPASGKFFYKENSDLYYATREAFRKTIANLRKKGFLSFFRSAGCYLEDLCLEPVNRIRDDTVRRKKRKDAEPLLAERLKGYEPHGVVVVMRSIEPNVRRAMAMAKYQDVPLYALPFPRRTRARGASETQYTNYVRELSLLLEVFRAADWWQNETLGPT